MKLKLNEDFELHSRNYKNKDYYYLENKINGISFLLNDNTLKIVRELKQKNTIELDYLNNDLNNLISLQIISAVDNRINCKPIYDTLSIWLHVTDKCNLGCEYCYIPTLNSKQSIDESLFNLLGAKILKSSYIKTVNLKIAGGEPFLAFNKWKEKYISLAKQLEQNNVLLNTRIITNLTVFSDEMLNFIKDNEVSISVSLDGIKETHDQNRPYINSKKSSFVDTLENLNKLKDNNIIPGIMVTVTESNSHQMEVLCRYLIDNDIPFRIADVKGQILSSSSFEKAFSSIYSYLRTNNSFDALKKLVVSDLKTFKPDVQPCSMGKNSVAIYLDGGLFFCHTQFKKTAPLGHLSDEETIFELIQRGSLYHQTLSKDCLSCEFRLICAGGCPLYRVNGKSLMCSTYKKIIPQIFELYKSQELYD